MPKVTRKQTVSKRRTHNTAHALRNARSTHIARPARRRTSNPITSKIHRRLVLFPNVKDATWLTKLSWFGSVALKLFKLLLAVNDDLTADSCISGSGSTMLIGPNDFAALSPFASEVIGKDDMQVKALRAIPFERARLSKVKVKIVPSVDLGSRGGMYAAVLIRSDPLDAEEVGIGPYLTRFDPSYDNIIKHPNAVLAPVTRTVTLSCQSNVAPRDVRVHYKEGSGYANIYPTFVLLVAFSDLSSNEKSVNTGYAPAKSLFEAHLVGDLSLYEPGEMSTNYDAGNQNSSSWVTSLLSKTDAGTVGIEAFGRHFDVSTSDFDDSGKLDLRKIPYAMAHHIVTNFNRNDLLLELQAHRICIKADK